MNPRDRGQRSCKSEGKGNRGYENFWQVANETVDSIHWAQTFVRKARDMMLLHVMCIKYNALDQVSQIQMER